MNYFLLITLIIFILSYLPSWFFKKTKQWLEITSFIFFIISMIMLFLPNISIFFFIWIILLFLLLSSILPKKVPELDLFTPVLTNNIGKYIINPIGSAFFFILAFYTIWFFGRFIYPRIIPDIGGGDPIKVEVLLRETLPIFGDTTKSNIIKEAYLLHREQSSIILLIPRSIYGDKAIRLSDNEIKLMIPISETNE